MSIRVVASVIERQGRVLLCRRPAHKRHGGLWEFPGGKVEPGEDSLQAVRRELWEELGVEVQEVGALEFSVADPGSPFIIEFHPVAICGEPRALEHEALAWVEEAEVPRFALAPSDRRYMMWRAARPAGEGTRS